MITKEPKYCFDKVYKYAAEIIEKNDEVVKLKVKGFDNCVQSRLTTHYYELRTEMPEVQCLFSRNIFDKNFFEINKDEYNKTLTDNLCIGDNCVEAYIFKNDYNKYYKDVSSWNPIMYKTKLQLTEKGLYDINLDNYPDRSQISFSEHEMRQDYENRLDDYIKGIYSEITKLESQITKLRSEKIYIHVYKEMQQNAENELDGPEIGEII